MMKLFRLMAWIAPDFFHLNVAAAVVGAAVVGGVASNMAAGTAANAQEDAANQANATTIAQYNQNRADQMPWMTRGNQAGDALQYRLGLSPDTSNGADANYGALLKKFDQNDLNADPIYNESLRVGLEQGTQGVNRQAASNGSLNSGATLKALARFSTNLGASLGNDAYNRDSAYKTGVYNDLSGVSGTGQVTSNQIANAGTAAANTVANNTLGVGNSRAASAIGQSNSINSGISSASQFYQNQQLLNSLNQPGYAQGSANYNGYTNNASANGFGSAFTNMSNPAYG